MRASGMKGGLIIDEWKKHGLEKCITMEEREFILGKKQEYLYIKDK